MAQVSEPKQKEILLGIRTFFFTTAEYLQSRLPLSNTFLKNVYCLDESQIKRAESEQSFRYLLSALPQIVSHEEVTLAMDEWKMLSLDSTPNEWSTSEPSNLATSVDVYWHHTLNRRNPLGQVKYPTLGKVVKACLIFSHGNSDAERSFSVNKNVVTNERSSLSDETVIAVRLVKDGIRHNGGSACTVAVNKDMLQRVRASNAKYKDYLCAKKRVAEEAEKEKALKLAKNKQLENEKRQKEEHRKNLKRKQESIENNEIELHTTEQQQLSVLKTAETLLKEAEQKLAGALKDKNMDQVAVAQAMFEAASKKMKEANEKLNEISLKRQKFMSEKKTVNSELNGSLQAEDGRKKKHSADVSK